MGIKTEVTVQVINTWLSEDVLDEDINDVFKEKGLMNYSQNPSINEVFYEETILQSGQAQEINLVDINQFVLSKCVNKSFSYIHTITIKNIDSVSALQLDVTGVGYAGDFLGNPTGLIPIGPQGTLHFTTISGIDTNNGLMAIRNTGSIPLTYQMFLAGNV